MQVGDVVHVHAIEKRSRIRAAHLDLAERRGIEHREPGPHGTNLATHGRRFVLALPLLAAACSSPDPVYYTIVTRTGPTLPGGPKIVMVKDIGLASYLDRKEIVRSSQDYKLAVMSNDWWGESLGPMLGRVIVMGLAQRLPSSQVLLEGGAL